MDFLLELKFKCNIYKPLLFELILYMQNFIPVSGAANDFSNNSYIDPNYKPIDVNGCRILMSGDYSAFRDGFNGIGVYLCSGLFVSETFERPLYLGSATNLKSRITRGHISLLENNKHPNGPLQYAWIKRQPKDFVWFLIEVSNEKDVFERETYYLQNERPFADEMRGYNLAHFATSPMLGRKHTEESKEKMRQASTGKSPSEETRKKMSDIMKGRACSEVAKEKLRKHFTGLERNLSEETRKRMASQAKPFSLKDPDGNIINGFNLNQFCKDNNLSYQCMTKLLSGPKNYRKHRGYTRNE